MASTVHTWKASIKPDESGQHGSISDKLIIPDSYFNERIPNRGVGWHSLLQVLYQRENVLFPSQVMLCSNKSAIWWSTGDTARTTIWTLGLYLVYLQENFCKIRCVLLPNTALNNWNKVNYSTSYRWPPGNISKMHNWHFTSPFASEKTRNVVLVIWIQAQRAFRQIADINLA